MMNIIRPAALAAAALGLSLAFAGGVAAEELPTPPALEDVAEVSETETTEEIPEIVCPPERPNLIEGECYEAVAEPGIPQIIECPEDKPNLIEGQCYPATAEPGVIECDENDECHGAPGVLVPNEPETLAATGIAQDIAGFGAVAILLIMIGLALSLRAVRR